MPNDQISTQDIPVEESDWSENTEELPPRPRRRLLTSTTLPLIAVLLVACGFIGGVLVEKGQTTSSTGAGGGSLAARLAGLRSAAGSSGATSLAGSSGTTSAAGTAGAGSPTRRFGGAGGITVGQVSYLEGGTLYVESAEGNTVKVTTSAGSTVTKTVTSSVKGIHPGETVIVQGTPNSSGTVAARSISIGAGAGSLGRGLGGLFGGGGAAGGTRVSRGTGGSSEGPALFGK